MAQEAVVSDADEGEEELTVAPRLVARLDWQGRVLTGDALFCQRSLSRQACAAGADYHVIVKENQPALSRDLATLFARRSDVALSATSRPPWNMRVAMTEERGNGRILVRCVTASTALNDYLDWPGVAQVMMIERVLWERGEHHSAARYGITSLPPAVADAKRSLAVVRGHWQFEDGLHGVNDGTLAEDRTLIHKENGPGVMTIQRDTVVSVLHRAGWRTIAARLRYCSGHREEALALLGIPLADNA